MKIYAVGGCVRDELMGIKPRDFDYVVTGSTEEEMISREFKKVGKSFPVFIHPETGDEYALARKEVSTGSGYRDFDIEFHPDVTITQDLYRRDLTINAIARDIETDEIIDPFNGVHDITDRILRVVSQSSLLEDPCRVLRLARFAAKFPGFSIDIDTLTAFSNARYDNISPERVENIMMKALMDVQPSKFFTLLKNHSNRGDFKYWFKEIFDLDNKQQTHKWHMEGDSFVHTMRVLDFTAMYNEPLNIRFAALTHDLGKGITPIDILPAHHGHEKRGIKLVEDFCARLRIDKVKERQSKFTAQYHTHVHNFNKINDNTKFKFYDAIKNHIDDSEIIGMVSFYDNMGKLPYSDYGRNHKDFINLMKYIKTQDRLSDTYTLDEIQEMSVGKLIEARMRVIKKIIFQDKHIRFKTH
ncbi:MAG: multifunctional CCA tRNA nucleotidyl transferase/2'3'-cyclic phosphodiesterase/2'nucleotidase/phosphatase [Hyphomicrobiales bacterium]|nr:MAG: multifunctional CCA tRNA nucleotidyl transferase/2'3'-cyclic phosphodiesterase/2'nucleotidase/phosphatase [Hyphomicrobiales bacterium]